MAKKKGIFSKAEEIADDVVAAEGNLSVDPSIDKEEVLEESLKKNDGIDRRKVQIDLPVHIKLAGEKYSPGLHVFEAHQVETIREIVDKKIKSDLSVSVGRSYLVEKVGGFNLKVTEVGDLKSKLK